MRSPCTCVFAALALLASAGCCHPQHERIIEPRPFEPQGGVQVVAPGVGVNVPPARR
jgi:hypothetical protein